MIWIWISMSNPFNDDFKQLCTQVFMQEICGNVFWGIDKKIFFSFQNSLRPKKKNICVFQVSRPYLGFCPDPKHSIVNCEQNVVKFAEKCIEKCNFYIKYFDKIKCNVDRPYLVFSELKPETHIHFFLPNG